MLQEERIKLTNQKYIPLAAAFNKFIRFGATFYLMSLVNPNEFANWVSLSLILQYSIFLQLGTANAMGRETAIAFGEKNESKINTIMSATLKNYLIASVLLYIILHFVGYEYLFLYSITYFFLSQLSDLVVVNSRSRFKNNKVIFSLIIESIVIMLGIIFFLEIYMIKGLLVVFSVGALINIIIHVPYRIVILNALAINKETLKESKYLISQGLPLLIFNILMLLKDTWDIILIKLLYSEYYVQFASTQIFGNGVRVIGALVSIILIPNMAKEFGESKVLFSNNNIKIFTRSTYFFTIMFILFFILFFPMIQFLIENFIPQYEESKDIIYFRSVSVFLGLVSLPALTMINMNRKTSVAIGIISIVFSLNILIFLILNLYISTIYAFIIATFIGNLLLLLILMFSIKAMKANAS